VSVVVERNVTIEKLRILLSLGHESAELDYKDSCDLQCTRSKVELAKDVGAFQSCGGYIIIGVDNNGKPTGSLTEERVKDWDETKIRKQLGKYIPEPIDLLTAVYKIDNCLVAILYIGTSSNYVCVFKSDGNYEKDGRPLTIFKAGDVYIRNGTASERWQKQDFEKLLVQVKAEMKEQARTEFSESLKTMAKEMNEGLLIQSSAKVPLNSLKWNIDAQNFHLTVTELLRTGDRIAIRSLLLDMEKRGFGVEPLSDESILLLDRLVILGIASIILEEKDDVIKEVLRVLFFLYSKAFPKASNSRNERFGLEIILRVMLLGSLALRRRRFSIIRMLVLQSSPDVTEDYNNWIRHSVVTCSRSNILSNSKKGELIELSRKCAELKSEFIIDVPLDNDLLLNSLCQFDLLWNLIAMDEVADSQRDWDWYPSFSRFNSERTEPIIVSLINDEALREILFKPSFINRLTKHLKSLNDVSRKEYFMNWSGFHNNTILGLLE
jgi:hypothetical protein